MSVVTPCHRPHHTISEPSNCVGASWFIHDDDDDDDG